MVSDDSAVLTALVERDAVNDTPHPEGTSKGLPTGVFTQSDFECCDKAKPKNSLDNLVESKQRVASCEWDYILYKETDAVTKGGATDGDLYPVQGDGPYMKIGTAWGRCVFNQDAEACGPFCDDMTITMQGGIYITIAYSHEEGNTLEAPPGDNCESLLAGNFLNNLFEEGLTTERIANASRTAQPTSALLRTWTAILLNVYGSDLFARARREIGPFGGTPSRKASLRGIGSKGYARHARGLYGGMGLVIMGETVVSSMSGGAKVEQTGRLEYCPLFLAWAGGLEPEHDYPVIKGGAMKLWFRKKSQDTTY